MSITAEIDTRTKGDSFRDLGTALVNFVSTTGRREYGAGDNIEFNFLSMVSAYVADESSHHL